MTTDSGLRELVGNLVEACESLAARGVLRSTDQSTIDYWRGRKSDLLGKINTILTAAGEAQPTAPAGLWTISFEDERDFLSSASPIIGAVYSVGIEAVSRINKNPRGVKMLYGKVSSRAPTTPVQAGIEEKDSDEYEDDRPAKSPSAQDVAFAEGFRQGVKHGESLVPAGMVLVPERRLPDDGNGDDDAFNAGWNKCREAMLAAAPAPTLDEAFDQVKGALLRQVGTTTAADATQVTDCTCPSGDGSLRWPCPQHPPGLDYDDSCPYGAPNCASADDAVNCPRCASDIASAAAPAAQVVAEGPAVAWRVRVLHKPWNKPSYWSRWQEINAKAYAEAKASGAYYEYDTIELQELGVLAAAPAVVVDEAMKRRAAEAIANARAGRRGAPAITNVLDILPPKLLAEVMEDAEDALTAALKQGVANG